MLTIGTLKSEDIAVCVRLGRSLGWNQTEHDWARLLTLDPDGLFVAEYRGTQCGAVATVHYGNKLGWMGMLMVHPDFRRRGIGSALMNHGIEYLRTKNVRRIKIDATDAGRSVFLRLGFEDERPVHVYVGPGRAAGAQPDVIPQHIEAGHWAAIVEMDHAAFGADRINLLRLFNDQGTGACVLTNGHLVGYGFARDPAMGGCIGPVVAGSVKAARCILLHLLERASGHPAEWRLLPDNVEAKELAVALGFSLRERLTRMYLGTAANPGTIESIYATAGSELG